MNTEVIIAKKAGQVVPRGYLQTALKECPTCFGIAIQDNVDNEPLLDTSAEPRMIGVDELFNLVEKCKDLPMVISLGKIDNDFNPETDLQPYVFQQKLQDQEEPQDILAVFLEGDFPNYSKPGGGHTESYNFWENFIFPSLLEKFQLSEDNDEFFQKIKSSQFQQAVENPMGHRGVALFLPLTGDPIPYGKNELGGEFAWGTTSNCFKWGDATVLNKAAETAITAVKDTVKKSKSRLQSILGTTAISEVTPAGGVEPSKVTPLPGPGVYSTKDLHGAPSVWDKWPGASSSTHKLVKVPSGLQGNAKNRWIRTFLKLGPNDDLPKGKDNPDFLMPVSLSLMGFAQEQVSTNDDVKSLADRVRSFSASGSVSQQMKEVVEPEPKHTTTPPAEKPGDDKRPASDFLPESPAEEARAVTELVTDWATNPKAPTVKEICNIERKWPLFSVSKGIKFTDMGRWNIADIKMLTKKYPNEAARAFVEMRLKVDELGGFEPSVTGDEIDVKNPAVPKKPDTQVEVPPVVPATPQAGKKSRLSRLSAA